MLTQYLYCNTGSGLKFLLWKEYKIHLAAKIITHFFRRGTFTHLHSTADEISKVIMPRFQHICVNNGY